MKPIEIIKDLMGKDYSAFREDHKQQIAEGKLKQILEGQWVKVEDEMPQPNKMDENGHMIQYLIRTPEGHLHVVTYQYTANSPDKAVWYSYPASFIATEWRLWGD